METKLIKIADLKFADYNPRTISKENFERLRTSIKSFGFTVPGTVNSHKGRENVIIAGHMRTIAAEALGMTEVPCFIVNLDPQKERLLNIALNNQNLPGEYDEQLLAEMIVRLSEEDADIKLTGFDEVQISNILDDYMDTGKEEVEITEPPEIPESKEGEIFELGPHQLMCGSSTSPEDVEKLMEGKKATLVFMDPPYNVNYSGTGDKTSNTILNDMMTDEKFKEFSDGFIKNMISSMREGGVFYMCSGWSSYPVFASVLSSAGLLIRGVIVWVKNNAAMGWNDYRYEHEFMVKGKKEKHAKKPTKGVGILYGWKGDGHDFFGARDQYDVWEMPRESVDKYEHPTQKPDWLPMRAILNSSKRGEIVLDLFGGSGSTLIAAEKTGRIAYLMELDPRYCDVIRKRYKAYVEKRTQKQ